MRGRTYKLLLLFFPTINESIRFLHCASCTCCHVVILFNDNLISGSDDFYTIVQHDKTFEYGINLFNISDYVIFCQVFQPKQKIVSYKHLKVYPRVLLLYNINKENKI